MNESTIFHLKSKDWNYMMIILALYGTRIFCNLFTFLFWNSNKISCNMSSSGWIKNRNCKCFLNSLFLHIHFTITRTLIWNTAQKTDKYILYTKDIYFNQSSKYKQTAAIQFVLDIREKIKSTCTKIAGCTNSQKCKTFWETSKKALLKTFKYLFNQWC